MPTIALSNSVAFAQMSDPGKQFPWIRVFGTLGWIVAGLIISKLGIREKPTTFIIAAGASAFLGVWSFMLPNTPPKSTANNTSIGAIFGTDAFVLLKERSYLLFFITAILICIPLSFYYGFADSFLGEFWKENSTAKMTLGQMSEALFIITIPFLFYRLGVKKMLVLGMAAWAIRYICFAYGSMDAEWLLYAGVILHGICYDFFFVTGYMYTEKMAGEKIKNAAQSLFTFATYGVGMFIGTNFSGYVANAYNQSTTINGVTTQQHIWETIWLYPAIIASVVLLLFVLFFKEKKQLAAQ
jgi:nucleoside transporter